MSTANKKADLSKLAHLLEPGRLVYTVDGGVYRVASKVKGPDGFVFKLANLQGKPVPTPEHFRPVTAAYAKFAQWQRFVVAYNRDFDLYVKDYIRAAGLPVDNDMNWSKYFESLAKRIFSPAHTHEDREAERDEAIHHIIIYELAERRILDRTDSAGFRQAIKRFPKDLQNKPIEKQVTGFLMTSFSGRLREANNYVKQQIHQEDADSMWSEDTDEEGGEYNMLDTMDNATGVSEFDRTEISVDVAQFGKKFYKWLVSKQREQTAKKYMVVYNLYWLHALENGGGVKIGDLSNDWKAQTKHGNDYLKIFWSKLPGFLEEFITEHEDSLGDTSLWQMQVKDMKKQSDEAQEEKKRKTPAVHASLKTAADVAPATEFWTEDVPKAAEGIAENAAMMMAAEGEAEHHEEITAEGGPNHEDEGLYVRMVYLHNGNLELQATEALKSEFAANENWHPTIYELLEDFTSNGWEWVSPENVGALTEGDIIADPDGHLFWHERYQIEDPVEELRTAGKFMMQSGGALEAGMEKESSEEKTAYGDPEFMDELKDEQFLDNVHGAEKEAKEAFMADRDMQMLAAQDGISMEELWLEHKDEYMNEFHSHVGASDEPKPEEPPKTIDQIKETEEEAMEKKEPTDFKQIIEEVIGSGLFSSVGEPYYTHSGCDYCSPGMGNQVEDVEGYRNLEEAHKGEDHKIDFKLCGDCLNKLYYGETQ